MHKLSHFLQRYFRILESPTEDNKNNCHITINKPPIIDLTFHRTKAGDKSVDVIVGRLSLSLSVPFTEKLAMFVVDCLPKDTLDMGFINHGYVADPTADDVGGVKLNPILNSVNSLTVALRINRPEFAFIVETTSNKRRYFVTKCEILSDYCEQGTRLNLVVSLSGLHSLFFDDAVGNSTEPYTILKQCDVELSKLSTDEKGEKITLTVSSIYVQLNSRVFHSINDILNDVIEHFKIPEGDYPAAEKAQGVDSGAEAQQKCEDLWEPRSISEYVYDDEFVGGPKTESVPPAIHQIFLLPKIEIVVMLEVEEVPVLLSKSTVEMTVYDWSSSSLSCTCDLSFQSNYYNTSNQYWEPFLDPVVLDEGEYKPWDVNVRVFRDKSLPVLGNVELRSGNESGGRKNSNSGSSSDEGDEETGVDMMYLQPTNSLYNRMNRNVKTNLSTFLDDSDSENDDAAIEKLAAAISDLFMG